jgi:hypothetical protein
MRHVKPITILFATVVCATVFAVDAGAQSRGRSGGGGGGRSGGGHGPAVGRAVPRSGGSRVDGVRGGSRVIVSPRIGGRAPLRSFYYPYYAYRPGLSLGFYGLYGYGYPYGYASPYGAYGYSYGYYPPGYGYGGYGYSGYGYEAGGYGGAAYGAVRIQGAPRDAQVYVDGYYAGIVDDFDGAFQRLTLEDGAHQIEIRAPGIPPAAFDVNIQPGKTITLHVR